VAEVINAAAIRRESKRQLSFFEGISIILPRIFDHSIPSGSSVKCLESGLHSGKGG
jgi:hypothetical protein